MDKITKYLLVNSLRMSSFNKTPKFILRLIHLPPRIAYTLGLGGLIGHFVLLLTTSGRRSGKPRVTPLQYEEIDGRFYLGAALGEKADWVNNIRANPRVQLRVKSRRLSGTARVVGDPRQIADFLEVRLQRHPKMVAAILRSAGLSAPFERSALERYAQQLTLVVVTPDG